MEINIRAGQKIAGDQSCNNSYDSKCFFGQ